MNLAQLFDVYYTPIVNSMNNALRREHEVDGIYAMVVIINEDDRENLRQMLKNTGFNVKVEGDRIEATFVQRNSHLNPVG